MAAVSFQAATPSASPWSGAAFPRRGELDQSAVQRYHEIFDCLEK